MAPQDLDLSIMCPCSQGPWNNRELLRNVMRQLIHFAGLQKYISGHHNMQDSIHEYYYYGDLLNFQINEKCLLGVSRCSSLLFSITSGA